jgi:hypothetical protein
MDSTAIFDAIRGVTGAWARQRKAEEREASRIWRRRDALIRSRRMTIREAAWSLMSPATSRRAAAARCRRTPVRSCTPPAATSSA